jgi:hypothetical protein
VTPPSDAQFGEREQNRELALVLVGQTGERSHTNVRDSPLLCLCSGQAFAASVGHVALIFCNRDGRNYHSAEQDPPSAQLNLVLNNFDKERGQLGGDLRDDEARLILIALPVVGIWRLALRPQV